MRCQKCGYVSFDHLLACKKCGNDASTAREALGLVAGKPTMPFFLGALLSGGDPTPVAAKTAPAATPKAAPAEDMDSLFAEIDFGADELEFDLVEETSPSVASASVAETSSPKVGNDFSEMDDIEFVIGSALDEELAIDMSALDDHPSDTKVQTDDFELNFDLEEPKPVASAKASADASNGGTSKGDDGGISMDLDSELDFELDLGDLVPPPAAAEAQPASTGLEEMVIDLGDDDINGLLQELGDGKKEDKATA